MKNETVNLGNILLKDNIIINPERLRRGRKTIEKFKIINVLSCLNVFKLKKARVNMTELNRTRNLRFDRVVYVRSGF